MLYNKKEGTMYRLVNCDQGSELWFKERLGILTASRFNKLITNGGKLSASWEKEVNRCVAETILKGQDEGFQSDAMIRGQSLEYEGIDFFNFTYGYNFERTGFLRATDNGVDLLYGCSADAIDFQRSLGLEMKCPLSPAHIGYMSDILNGFCPEEHKQQVQGALLITGFDKWCFGSYHPELRSPIIEIGRDEEYIKKLEEILARCTEEFYKRLELERAKAQ